LHLILTSVTRITFNRVKNSCGHSNICTFWITGSDCELVCSKSFVGRLGCNYIIEFIQQHIHGQVQGRQIVAIDTWLICQIVVQRSKFMCQAKLWRKAICVKPRAKERIPIHTLLLNFLLRLRLGLNIVVVPDQVFQIVESQLNILLTISFDSL